ncbi:MAG: DUF5685 family protein [Bacillota bacterium]
MFGYVQPLRPELRLRDMTLYKAFYCGQCKAISRRYGAIARGFLSYDTALCESGAEVNNERCIVNPFKKKPVAGLNAALEFAADANVILAFNKLRDDWRDERSKKAAAGRVLLARAYRRAQRARPELSSAVEAHMKELAGLEHAKCAQMDMVADVFARLMQILFAGVQSDPRDARALSWMAYNLGKWLYLTDALDDVEKDVASGAYNAIWLQYGAKGDAASCRRDMLETVEFNLKTSLSQCAAGYELLHVRRYKELLDNIIYLGLMDRTERVLKGESKRSDESV